MRAPKLMAIIEPMKIEPDLLIIPAKEFGAFRNLGFTEPTYSIAKNTRLTQICHPSLCPIKVHIVDSEELLGATARGENGFGSTGK